MTSQRRAPTRYTPELRRHLDTHFTPEDISRRLLDMTVRLELLKGRLQRNWSDIAKTLTSDDGLELRTHIMHDCSATARKLARTPVPPRVRWTGMREDAMRALRRHIRAFQKWDSKMSAFVIDLKQKHDLLKRLARRRARHRRRNADRVQQRVDDLYNVSNGTARKIYVLFTT